MKNQNEQLEQELLGHWDGNKPLPDVQYFGRVLRRNWLVWVFGVGVTTVLSVIVPQLVDNSYRSSVYAMFDNVDVSGSGVGTSPQVSYNTVARLFRARFESPQFLLDIGEKLGLDAENDDESLWDALLRSVTKGRLKLDLIGAKTEVAQIEIARAIGRQIQAKPEPDTGLLVLNVSSASPKLAQNMANTAMELFIRTELEEQIKSLDLKLSFLQKNIVKPAEPAKPLPVAKVTHKKKIEKLKSEDRERELEDRLRNLNAQLDGFRVEKAQSLTEVKRELVRLQTNLQPNHPQVIEKKRESELMNAQVAATEARLVGEIDRVRRGLGAVRSSQPLPPDLVAVDIRNADSYQGNFYTAVSDRIKDIELERKNLQRQVVDPTKRTRIRIVFPATFEPLPFKNNRIKVTFAVGFAGLILTLFLIGFREYRNPRARDPWRIERSTGQALIAQISQQHASEFSDISPRLADQLRTHLSRANRIDSASRTLLSYRRLELAMIKNCQGRVVLLLNAGPFDETSQVVKNFLNVYATDHKDEFLLIDCNLQDPVYRKLDKEGPGLIEFLENEARFEDVVIRRDTLEGFAFDMIPAMRKISGEKTRSFREETTKRMIGNVPDSYRQIFIRGMPESHFIENMSLLQAASDAFIFIDVDRTHYFDLQRTISHLQSEKQRGLVALGT